MSTVWRSRERKRLIAELESPEYLKLLQRLQEESSFPRQFASWAEVLDFMCGGSADDTAKDLILVPIFRAHRDEGDGRWLTILWAIFWPGLASIQNTRWKWDRDKAEFWQNILTTFLRVVRRVDPATRSERLAQKVYNDTIHELYEAYQREWARRGRTNTVGIDELEKLVEPVDGEFHQPEAEDERQAQVQALKAALDSKRISEPDYLLLLGTRVYGQSVADYARANGLKYQTVKKRRQRAERILLKTKKS